MKTLLVIMLFTFPAADDETPAKTDALVVDAGAQCEQIAKTVNEIPSTDTSSVWAACAEAR